MCRTGFINHARAKLRNLTQFPAELLFHRYNSLERMVFSRVLFVFSSDFAREAVVSIDTGRRRLPFPIPRAQRFCLQCASQLVCDEIHVIFECTALPPIREQFSALFTSATQSMLGFMWQQDTYAVAVFVARCRRYLDVANT
jgi:hypothetical protein